MARPKVHDEALRVRLLERAGHTLSTDGLDALSLRRLAKEVGTSTTAVYSLFDGKPGLLAALFDEAFSRFGDRLAAVEPSADPLEDITRLGLAYRASALADPQLYPIMFGTVVGAIGATLAPEPASLAAAGRTFEPLLGMVRRAVEAGVLKPHDPGTIAVALWAMVHGLVSLELRGLLPPGASEPGEIFEAAVRANLNGWCH